MAASITVGNQGGKVLLYNGFKYQKNRLRTRDIGVAGGRNVGPIYKQMFSTSMIGIQIFKSYKKVPIHTRRTI
jgi:hypothetical protein